MMNPTLDTTVPSTVISTIDPAFTVSDTDADEFRRHGFRKLRKIFSPDLVEYMRSLAGGQVTPPSGNYGSGFSKLKYDIGNDDSGILSAMSDATFGAAMSKLTEIQSFFTQGLGFELAKNTSTGFPWHVGTQSFGFQRRQDTGFTIWTPLCEIDPSGQRGGMAYVSKELLSGEFVYQHINLLPEYIRSLVADGRELAYGDFEALKNNLLNSHGMNDVLNHYAVEDAFEPGDALIFDKYVLHRSVRLEEGPIPSRLAFALRFCSVDARYDLARVRALAFPRVTFDYDVDSTFNEEVGQVDGEEVYRSTYFDGSREARTLGPSSDGV